MASQSLGIDTRAGDTRLDLLDYGRLVAALSVVAFHYFFNGINNGKLSSLTHSPALVPVVKYGYLGVALFFMISGYVIFLSANNKTVGQFMAARATRLYPAFWAAALITFVAAQFWGGSQMSVSLPQLLANLTMFPSALNQPYVDGVYWTLLLEWKFYFAVALILALGQQRHLRTIALAWPVYIYVAQAFGVTDLPFASGYFCYFAAGMIFAEMSEQRSLASFLSLVLVGYLCVAFAAQNAMSMAANLHTTYPYWVTAAIVVGFFGFFLALATRWGKEVRLPGARLAGGLTYPIYLVHAHLGYMLLSRFADEQHKWLWYAVVVALVVGIALAIHLWAERRLALTWKRYFGAVGSAADQLQRRALRFAGPMRKHLQTAYNPGEG